MARPTWLDHEEPSMAAAMDAARESSPRFAREIEMERWRMLPAFDAVLVKAFIATEQDASQGEFLFVTDVVLNAETLRGTLASEPRDLTHVAAGDDISIPRDNLCDWMLVADDRGLGGFTVDVLRREIPAEYRAEYESYPPVAWYTHRTDETAADEISRMEPCPECHDFDYYPSRAPGEPCGCCRNGLARTRCAACGMGIIRGEGAPDRCFGCLNGL